MTGAPVSGRRNDDGGSGTGDDRDAGDGDAGHYDADATGDGGDGTGADAGATGDGDAGDDADDTDDDRDAEDTGDAGGRGGTYTLLVVLDDPATVEVGALGSLELPAGAYAYTGSALGAGGFARVERHRELARGDRNVRHWHVDHLLGLDAARIAAVVRSPGADAECAVARSVPGERVPGFGATDCGCDSHLRFDADRERLLAAVRTAHPRPVVDELSG